jgi:flagellar hook-associated protein 1 FlgK
MGVNFSPFEIGRRALRASQLGLAIAGQNIANVNTPGYSRQTVMLAASPGNGTARGYLGSGVDIVGVRQFRDRFVESRLQTESSISGRLTAQRDALYPVDGVFSSTGSADVGASMNEFFGAFTSLEANPSSLALRSEVIAKAQIMSNAFANTRSRLSGIRLDTDLAIRDTVTQINTVAGQIADLNQRISVIENSGGTASELRDQRNILSRSIADLGGARVLETPEGMVNVTLADGASLVTGVHQTELEIVNELDGTASLILNGGPAVVGDGRLRGLQNAMVQVEEHITSLDDLAASIATRVNTLHTSGTDLNGANGTPFFNVSTPVTAANLAVAANVKVDPKLVVASQLASPTTAGTVAGAIGALLSDPTSIAGTRTGSFNSIFNSIVGDAGRGVRSAEDALVTQQAILEQAMAQRDAVSGVSLDEEAISLLQFQKSYEAAARFLKIADDLTATILSLGQ